MLMDPNTESPANIDASVSKTIQITNILGSLQIRNKEAIIIQNIMNSQGLTGRKSYFEDQIEKKEMERNLKIVKII